MAKEIAPLSSEEQNRIQIPHRKIGTFSSGFVRLRKVFSYLLSLCYIETLLKQKLNVSLKKGPVCHELSTIFNVPKRGFMGRGL